ncbi:GntR family transcriptional regulator [Micromonospora sp. MA102]|uniref:GntR family transcriptional regulator n=1 Tax=Micromonospora sp. MA102 TaxID=2952755 RepID=UPI0029057364|nr:GntR family transcriptional regulator [Micromonospora sp. MA102]
MVGAPVGEQVPDNGQDRVGDRDRSLGSGFGAHAALCEHYDVSNTVIRAAMLILKAEGLIDGRQGKGVYVATPPFR